MSSFNSLDGGDSYLPPLPDDIRALLAPPAEIQADIRVLRTDTSPELHHR